MALQNVNDNFLIWPGFMRYHTATGADGARTTIDGAGEYFAVIFCAQEDMAISHVYFRPHAVAGSPTCEIRIETVDSSTGFSTGTLWATDTNIVTGTLDTTGATHALTASASISRGQWFAVKFLYNSGTSFTTREMNAIANNSAFCYTDINTGTPTKGTVLGCVMAVGSSATSFYQLPGHHYPESGMPGTGSINNTNGARHGARFMTPFKCEIHGVVVGILTFNAFDITFYDDSGNVISGATASALAGPHGMTSGRCGVLIGTPFTPDTNTWYRVAVVPTSASNVALRTVAVPSLDYLTALPGKGNVRRTDYTTAGGWSDANEAQLPEIDLLIRRIDDGASAGGGARQKVYGG